LSLLDKLERYPEWLDRFTITIVSEKTGEIKEALVYILTDFNDDLLSLEMGSNFNEKHGFGSNYDPTWQKIF